MTWKHGHTAGQISEEPFGGSSVSAVKDCREEPLQALVSGTVNTETCRLRTLLNPPDMFFASLICMLTLFHLEAGFCKLSHQKWTSQNKTAALLCFGRLHIGAVTKNHQLGGSYLLPSTCLCWKEKERWLQKEHIWRKTVLNTIVKQCDAPSEVTSHWLNSLLC